MRFLLIFLVGCSSAATNLLCTACNSDGDCHGNPCFQEASGGRFCGRPCDSGCPAGFSCKPVVGSGSSVVKTCYPDTAFCQAPIEMPDGGPVGPSGGSVDRLFFGFTGDTRPENCDGPYPQSVINNIFTGMSEKGVQFALDQGDHMFNCTGGAKGAVDQMNAYLSAASLLGKRVFMTMGNHECTGESTALCTLASETSNYNYSAFMAAMRRGGFDKPYYRFDVSTASGLAVFIVIADDVWDSAEQTWLEQQLQDADANAKYTFVSKHHPDGNNDYPQFQQIYDLVTQHKYTLFFTGHTHEYHRHWQDPRGLIIGCGGAPLAQGGFWGYGIAQQGMDDRIYVTVYDQASGNVMDQFDVAPQ